MAEIQEVIFSGCPLYACHVCRTKTGWPHQRWCSIGDIVRPGCKECAYSDSLRHECAHPAREERCYSFEKD